ncbi:MAG: AbrB/MazE/SpoVT family DNA-binding domain-containing protein [Gemmatimonadetes bacterium]|nr:AbrB/MazE/SpoVT family DNA-binding domain-containing protein [Gemmatimonadota bacterium]MYA64344.1 AbrB/MazE/SpoVT family DNA-binding domain-containing protein [Gemmatimonadota bacterium]MYB99242.1 AbrB/MazE/SpoVT family DNA-binding domain-containing protein [Gemmatimonadota bacterium]MYH54032.1 AbrB/MazE/SpoVT family DNA-binding domain-containing protein [Gemmatimonadota bacterium]MYI45337.1 AbrB/MazE/SpoVT family DNA-binding domain-containing protein [Gemmatimonadota bacterium]
MGAQSTVAKWGASLAIRIPKAIAEQWGVREGSAVELVSRGEQVVIRKKRYDLAEMLAKVSPDNLHSEVDFGPPAGREEW